MLAALWTDRRVRRRADFLRRLAIEALNGRAVMLGPKTFQPSKKRDLCYWLDRFIFRSESHLHLWRRRHEMGTTLPTHRALRRGIFHLLKATVRTLHTDFSRGRICHGARSRKGGYLGAGSKYCLGRSRRVIVPDDLRSRSGTLGPTSACYFGFADKGCTFFNHEPGGFEISLESAT